MEPNAAEVDRLLANSGWVHALARQLLADAGLAEDAVQDTWVAALRSAPGTASSRPWLARVVRNFARQRARSETARTERERAVARPEPLPPASEVAERAELHGRLVRAVLAVEEPFRSALLWRYFEELPAEEIARRSGIEPATVRSRLKRGRERLRELLTERDGTPPDTWLSALLPASARGSVESAVSVAGWGCVLVGAQLWVGVACAAMIATGVWWASTRGSERSAEPARPGSATFDTPLAVAPAVDPPGSQDGTRVASSVPNGRSTAAAGGHSAMFRGVVLGQDGRRPLAGARISLRRGAESGPGMAQLRSQSSDGGTQAGADGAFAIEVPSEADVGLWFEHAEYFPLKLASGDLPPDPSKPIEVVLAPLGTIDVRVADTNGAPVSCLAISYTVDLDRGSVDQRQAFGFIQSAGVTNAGGALRVERVPCGMTVGLRLGEAPRERLGGTTVIDVNTRRATCEVRVPGKATLRARLVDAAGRPKAGVRGWWHEQPVDNWDAIPANSADDGSLRLPDLDAARGELRIDVPGFEPVQLALQPGEVRDLGDIVLAEILELSGRLVSRVGPVNSGIAIQGYRGSRRILEIRAEEDGRFATTVAAGPVRLFVTRNARFDDDAYRDGEILAVVDLPEPTSGLEIEIDRGQGALALVAAMTSLDREQGPDNFMVYRRTDDGRFELCTQSFREPDGTRRLLIGPLAPGMYAVSQWTGVQSRNLVRDIRVDVGKVTEVGALVAAEGTLAGRVLDAASKPVPEAIVSVRSLFGQPRSVLGEAKADSAGRYRIEHVLPDVYIVEVLHPEAGALRVDGVAIAGGMTTELELGIRAHVTVRGLVRRGDEPVSGLQLKLQPYALNTSWATATAEDGSFVFERLPAGRLRIWSSSEFMRTIDAEPGETVELTLALEPNRPLRFLKDGEPIGDLTSVQAASIDANGEVARHWSSARASGESAELAVPNQPVLFAIDAKHILNSETYVAVAAVVANSGDVVLSDRTLDIVSSRPWNGPPPRAGLVSLGGPAIVGPWGRPIPLRVEQLDEISFRVPHLPERAVVMLEGLDSSGRRHEQTLETGSDSRVRVTWP